MATYCVFCRNLRVLFSKNFASVKKWQISGMSSSSSPWQWRQCGPDGSAATFATWPWDPSTIWESLFISLIFLSILSLSVFFICRLSLFSIHPRIFPPPYAPFFYFSQICQWPLLSISYILSPHYEPVFCYPSIILPLYKTLFYLSHRFEIFGQWKFPSIFSLRLLFQWEGNDASNFL